MLPHNRAINHPITPTITPTQLCRIILMQAVADCIYSTTAAIWMFSVYCGPLLNWYAFMAAMFESVWVAVLAFHLAAQASGYWVEAERWGPRYNAFALVYCLAYFFAAFSLAEWDFFPCVDVHPSGVRNNDKMAMALVFSTVIWCAGCIVYTRLYLGVKLYSTVFLTIYILCWGPQITWFILQYTVPTSEQGPLNLNSPVWSVAITIMLALDGILNAAAYSTMPPDKVLYRIINAMRHGNVDSSETGGHELTCRGCMTAVLGPGHCCCCLSGSDDAHRGDVNSVDELRMSLLAAETAHDGGIAFDTAADYFLAAIVRQHGTDYDGLVIPPSSLLISQPLGQGSFGTVYSGTYQGVAVAIKELHCGLQPNYMVGNPLDIQELLHEASMLTRARHKNVVSFLGISLGKKGRLLLVMEKCECSLRQHIDRAVAGESSANNSVGDANVAKRSARGVPQSHALILLMLRASIDLFDGLDFLHTVLRVVHRGV